MCNYTILDQLRNNNEISVYLPIPGNKKEKQDIKFTNKKQKAQGKQKQQDIKNKPGLTRRSRQAETEKDVFSLFITGNMTHNLVEYTNKRINRTISISPEYAANSDKYPYVKIVDEIDIMALFGLLYFRGLYGLNGHNRQLLYSGKKRITCFWCHHVKAKI